MSLSDALRAAALERARRSGHTIDGVVIEPTGVIDLREMARSAGRETDRSVKLPVIAGYLNRPDRDDEVPLTQTALWRRLRPADATVDVDDESETGVELDLTVDGDPVVDMTASDLDALLDAPGPAPSFDPIEIDLSDVTEPSSVHERHGLAPIDAGPDDGAGRPSMLCGHCGSFGERDLFDRFSRTEYYSCADCGHMWQQTVED